jgi:MSHA pilin protein MshA
MTVLKGRTKMKRSNQGFTLIELIAVIAILAILAATAIPQFVNLQSSARSAATSGVAGAISSASTMAYARKIATGFASSPVTNCNQLTSAAGFVSGPTVISSATPPAGQFGLNTAALTSGSAGSCTLTNGDDNTIVITFSAVGN